MADRASQGRDTVITFEEWERELRSFSNKDDDGLTSEEVAEAWGCCRKIALERLRKLDKAGKLETGTKTVTRLGGRLNPVPCYRLKVASKKSR